MCGICGSVSVLPVVDQAPVARMQAALLHRGPDGDGRHDGPHVALAMRRLSIIDLKSGWQPLYNEDRSLVLVANAEIYNHHELRRELEGRGHTFRTRSDCETILHVYEEHGTRCPEYLRGMFAFALWDARLSRLLLARDRMGEKPLYLHEADGHISFVSELKALLRSESVGFALDPTSLDLFFHYQYIPEPRAPVLGVRKLPAGHVLVIDAKTWQTEERCYWRIEDAPPLEGEPPAILRAELEDVAGIVFRADVPIGIALSGGMDSGAIAALAVDHARQPLHAFSVGYKGRPDNDERLLAQELASRLGMTFHDIELTDDDVARGFPQLVSRLDDPIADYSGFAHHAVAQVARRVDVPVIMQGQGADELFWGYRWVREALAESERRIDGRTPDDGDRLAFYDCNPGFRAAVDALPKIYTPDWRAGLDPNAPYAIFTNDPIDDRPDLQITKLICITYLAENGIAQNDRLSMANCVELRLPFVDHRFVEAAIGIRKARPDHDEQPKARLRQALHGTLPTPVIQRPKRAFETPERRWHRSLFDAYGSLLSDGYLVQSGILRGASARTLAKGAYTANAGPTLPFKALVLEMWCRFMATGEATG
jgi:asparagine synthase (glutamine-hydrolysing)